MNKIFSRGSDLETPSGGNASFPIMEAIDPKDIGSITISPSGEFEAGSYQTFKLTYKAGKFGIDDSGSIRICFRFASDHTSPQFNNPIEPNYTTITASNNAVLQYSYDAKGNVRPWDKTIYIKVVRGFLKEGETIEITFGDKSKGSPGMRIQTFCEESFEFHTLIDPIATRCYQPVLDQPVIKIVPGIPEKYLAVAPTLKKLNDRFSIFIKGEDIWGNPSNKCNIKFKLVANYEVEGLPETISLEKGEYFKEIKDLVVKKECDLIVKFEEIDGKNDFKTNPIRFLKKTELLHFWGDLHGQSEETIGTGSAEEYFNFAKKKAFLDVIGHQGNDFQITKEFWRKLNNLTKKFDETGKFIVIPGYEWSGNTGLGGDRNVFFPNEGRVIRRSSHAMLDEKDDLDTDCNTAKELFETFIEKKEFDVVMYAHCGGRYADIKIAHDGRFEKSIEVHSSWGTFEWLMNDAFKMGFRVGIVGNSDGHKGRPGASYPGSSMFGAVGGLTCFLSPSLERSMILDSMRKRRHYATTGGHSGRLFIEKIAKFTMDGDLYHDDPKLFPPKSFKSKKAIMGDIVHLPKGEMDLEINIHTSSPIERIEIFNGLEKLETFRPFSNDELENRIRVIWEGAEYRGRFRQVIWDGEAKISGNSIVNSKPINFFNPDKSLVQNSSKLLSWKALTTGNIGGFDILLEDRYSGTLKIKTPLVKEEINIDEISMDDKVFDKSDELPRYLKVFRLPNKNENFKANFVRRISLNNEGDNPIYIRLTQEDGTIAWTSPIYVYR